MAISAETKQKDFLFYIGELKGNECQCGKWKKPGRSFCFTCYRSLPRHMQGDLYCRIGQGYEEAYDEAIKFLNA